VEEEITYLKGLNEAQRGPVVHKEGPLMVIAGAGLLPIRQHAR